jgi:hypothetical protein
MSDMNSTVKRGEQSLVKDERNELHRQMSSFTRLCSPHLTMEFISLIFYQTLFTPLDGGVHVAHLLPDSVLKQGEQSLVKDERHELQRQTG